MFFVHWKSLITGNQGRGTQAFPHDEAQEYADELNRVNAGMLTHWIESAAQQPHAGDGATGAQADVQSLSSDSSGEHGGNNPPRA